MNRTTGGQPDLHYLDVGPATGPVLVLLHSLGADHRMWAQQVDRLARTHRVLVPDARGHGRSGWTGDSVEVDDWVTDTGRVLDHAGVPVATLVGVSMGGVQAMAFATRHPDRVTGLVVADSFAQLPDDTVQAKIDGLAGPAGANGMAALADSYVRGTFTAEELPASAEDVRKAIAGMDEHAYVASTRTCFTARLDDALSSVDVPALVLWGSRDSKTPRELSERIAARLSSGRLAVVPDAGHLSNIENPGEFTRLVERFLAEPEVKVWEADTTSN